MIEIFDGGEKASVYEIVEHIAYVHKAKKPPSPSIPSPPPTNVIKPLYMWSIWWSYTFYEIVFAVAIQVRSCFLFRAVFVLVVARTS